jgi:hypothetical protein
VWFLKALLGQCADNRGLFHNTRPYWRAWRT